MNGHECYIIGAGDFFGLREAPDDSDYVIAADAGAAYFVAVAALQTAFFCQTQPGHCDDCAFSFCICLGFALFFIICTG